MTQTFLELTLCAWQRQESFLYRNPPGPARKASRLYLREPFLKAGVKSCRGGGGGKGRQETNISCYGESTGLRV